VVSEGFKGSKKDFKKQKKIKGTTGSSRQEAKRHRQSFVAGKTVAVVGPSKVSERTVEKFLSEKKNCDLRASLPLTMAYRLKEFYSKSLL